MTMLSKHVPIFNLGLSGISLLSSVPIMPSYGGQKPLKRLAFAFHGSISTVYYSTLNSLLEGKATQSQSLCTFNVITVSVDPNNCCDSSLLSCQILKYLKTGNLESKELPPSAFHQRSIQRYRHTFSHLPNDCLSSFCHLHKVERWRSC